MVYVNVSAWMRVSLCLCVRVYAGWWWWWYDIFHPVESMRSWFSMYSSFYCISSHHPLFHAVVCRGERAPISIFTFPIFDNKLIQSMTTVLFVWCKSEWRSSGNNSRRTDTKIRQKKIKVQSNIDWHHFHMHTLTHTPSQYGEAGEDILWIRKTLQWIYPALFHTCFSTDKLRFAMAVLSSRATKNSFLCHSTLLFRCWCIYININIHTTSQPSSHITADMYAIHKFGLGEKLASRGNKESTSFLISPLSFSRIQIIHCNHLNQWASIFDGIFFSARCCCCCCCHCCRYLEIYFGCDLS